MKDSEADQSQVSFWTRIINFFSENPWRKGLFYPGVFFLSFFPALKVWGNTSGFVQLLCHVYLGFSFMGPPLFILLGLFLSKKKLPYAISLFLGLASPFIILANIDFFLKWKY